MCARNFCRPFSPASCTGGRDLCHRGRQKPDGRTRRGGRQLTGGSCDGVPKKPTVFNALRRTTWTQQRNPFALGNSHGYLRDSRDTTGRVRLRFRSDAVLRSRWPRSQPLAIARRCLHASSLVPSSLTAPLVAAFGAHQAPQPTTIHAHIAQPYPQHPTTQPNLHALRLVRTGVWYPMSTIVDTLSLQHLGQQPADLLDRQLLAADPLPLVVLVGRGFHADVGKLGGEQDTSFEPGQGGIARRWTQGS